jgi:hypothetical protein
MTNCSSSKRMKPSRRRFVFGKRPTGVSCTHCKLKKEISVYEGVNEPSAFFTQDREMRGDV